MYDLCGLCNIFDKNKSKSDQLKMLKESLARDTILHDLDFKIETAEIEYNNNPTTENMLKCISAANIRNKYLENNQNKINKTKLFSIDENSSD